MLPQSHIGYTLLTCKIAERWIPATCQVDYRLLAMAAITPDLLDKPLVLATYRHWSATKLLAHTGSCSPLSPRSNRPGYLTPSRPTVIC